MIRVLVLTFIFLISSASFAATVSKIKGDKVKITLEGSVYTEGEVLEVLDQEGNQIGIVKVYKISSKFALADLRKGNAPAGSIVEKMAKSSDDYMKQILITPAVHLDVGGVFGTEYDELPFQFSLEYIKPINEKQWQLRGGVSYWIGSSNVLENTVLAFQVGYGKYLELGPNSWLEYGLRAAYMLLDRKENVGGSIDLDEEKNFGAGLYAAWYYKVNHQYCLGLAFNYLASQTEITQSNAPIVSFSVQYNL